MIQYVAVLTGAVLVAILLANPGLVKPLTETVTVSAQVQLDIPIGSLGQSPVGEAVSVSGVLMKLERETEDAILLTFADSSGSIDVPYLDTDLRSRVFEVGTVYRVTGIVVGKDGRLLLVPQKKDDVKRTPRSPSELLKKKVVSPPVVATTTPPSAGSAFTSGYYVVLASMETREEAELRVSKYRDINASNILIVPTVVNSETRYRVVVGPHRNTSAAKVELRKWTSVDGAWIKKL